MTIGWFTRLALQLTNPSTVGGQPNSNLSLLDY